MLLNNVVINTPSGKLQGSLERSCLGDNYYAFKGVPYAKPPIGQLRFRDPQPLEPWTDIRDTRSYAPVAAQLNFYKQVIDSEDYKQVIGSEDCLYLNVHTRNLNANSRLPVMFWIPGGGYYTTGNDTWYGPDYLMSKDIVLISINFRTGVFGFFDLRNKEASGNQGLKDQVMALEWVKKHILSFGGDPDNVTIFGESTGAQFVHLLAVSQMAKGLFHKAILQSGTVMIPLAVHRIPNEEDMNEFLQCLNIHEKDPTAILENLRKISTERLIAVQEQLVNNHKLIKGKLLFMPTIDDKSEKPFMPLSPEEAAKQGIQVPLMIGYTESEGLYYLNRLISDLTDVDRHLENYMPTEELQRTYNLTLEELRYLYFGNVAISEKNLVDLVHFFSDVIIIENTHRLVKIQMHCGSASTYLYKLTYDRNLTFFKKDVKYTARGPGHCDELTYLFREKICEAANFEQLQKGTGADRVMRQMVELWTNFAKTGRPTLEKSDLLPLYWLPVTDDTVLRYLNIGEDLRMEKELNLEQRYSYKKIST